ncbi:shikimate kinase [Diaphorobacter aerolatus]|uniref:Shikimate kinase n=1 Tax=Diaphorobacter aerolatus TaxID=1288495 RepID=A0A7H0GFX0_9BURK|nr:shikimate kinase [Diaphorobacter aerolatus]QNP47186.1 shikimate kinase [Diaphorobacter aerolatus]
MRKRCSLVGMPGSGKSTVGRQLARRLEVPFIDLDQRLEEVLGSSIRQYFEEQGEEAFRKREADLLAELTSRPGDMILSTGGGAVLREDNRANLLAHGGSVMYLRAAPDEIFKRIRHDKARPLLQVTNPLQRLRDLHAERDPLYRAASHYVIETGRPTVNTLVNMIVMQLEMVP